MKKLLMVFALIFVLCGCNSAQEFETVTDTWEDPVQAAAGELRFAIPSDAALEVFEGDGACKLYLCDGYDLVMQTLDAGELERTLSQISGYPADKLTVIETLQQTLKRFDCIWSSSGELGDQLVRAAILDDGNYHYVLMAMADASRTAELQETWQSIFDSFTVINTAA